MFNIFKNLFGSTKVIEAGIDGIDAMVFTDEEKSNAKMKFLKLYEPYKIAQRYLAVIYAVPYAIAWLVTFMVSFFRPVDVQIVLLTGDAFYINIVILSFYFGGGFAEGVISKAVKK